jgi:hypothetical protein
MNQATKDSEINKYINSNKTIDEIKIIKTFIDSCLNLEICKQINTVQFDKYLDVIRNLIKSDYNKELDDALLNKLESFDKLNAIIKYLNDKFH